MNAAKNSASLPRASHLSFVVSALESNYTRAPAVLLGHRLTTILLLIAWLVIDPTDQTPRPLSVPCPLSHCFTAPSFSRALVLCLWLLKIDFFLLYIDSCQQPALSYACRVTVRHKRCCLPGHERSSIHVMYTQVFVIFMYMHTHINAHTRTRTHTCCAGVCVYMHVMKHTGWPPSSKQSMIIKLYMCVAWLVYIYVHASHVFCGWQVRLAPWHEHCMPCRWLP